MIPAEYLPFLRAVAAAPDDDVPRLVFADFLREQRDDIWADAIVSGKYSHHMDLRLRNYYCHDYSRGFLCGLEFQTSYDFIRYAPDYITLWPIRHIMIRDRFGPRILDTVKVDRILHLFAIRLIPVDSLNRALITYAKELHASRVLPYGQCEEIPRISESRPAR